MGNTFAMICGVAGSGKSTISERLLNENGNSIIISSDSIRKELYGSEDIQGNNVEVFDMMRARTLEHLKNGTDVIYDATNINRKRRKGFLKQLPKDVYKVVIYCATPYDEIVSNNLNRERVVPENVINNMYKTLHTPTKNEGWNEIIFHTANSIYDLPTQVSMAIRGGVLYPHELDYKEIFLPLASFFKAFSDVIDLPQDSSYHSFSVSRHIYYVYEYVIKNIEERFPDIPDIEKELLIWSSLLHDVGKKFCKSFKNRKDETVKYANFIGHENVSAQLAVSVLTELGFSQDFIIRATTLIQFHMYLLNKDNNVNKLIGYVGEKNYEYLKFLRDADNYAH